MAAAQARRLVWVEGMVQGVGFRWWVQGQATRLGLVGHARNLADGRVEVDVQGPHDAVQEMVRALTGKPSFGRGRRPGHVDSYLVEARAVDLDAFGFDIQ